MPPRAQGLNKKPKNTKEIHLRKKKVILKATNKNKINLKRNQKVKTSEDNETHEAPDQVPIKEEVIEVIPGKFFNSNLSTHKASFVIEIIDYVNHSFLSCLERLLY